MATRDGSERVGWFDSQAHQWDKPSNIQMAEKAVDALCKHVTVEAGVQILEIGSGTGLCTKMLVDRGAIVTGVDTSDGMISAFKDKAKQHGVEDRMKAVKVDLSGESPPEDQLRPVVPEGGFDIAFSHLTFHHLPSMDQALLAVHQLLKEGGRVAVSDFMAHEFSTEFHPSHMHAEVARHGVEPAELASAMEAAGFTNVTILKPFKYAKEVEAGGSKEFEFLLVIAEK